MKIFTQVEEQLLKKYRIKASKMGYGFSSVKLRGLAYEFAVKLEKRLPRQERVIQIRG